VVVLWVMARMANVDIFMMLWFALVWFGLELNLDGFYWVDSNSIYGFYLLESVDCNCKCCCCCCLAKKGKIYFIVWTSSSYSLKGMFALRSMWNFVTYEYSYPGWQANLDDRLGFFFLCVGRWMDTEIIYICNWSIRMDI